MTNNLLVTVVLVICFVVLAAAAGVHHTLGRIWRFQRQRFRTRKSGVRLLPRSLRRWEKASRLDLRDLRDFAFNLQLGTSMEATLSRALAQTAEQFSGRKDLFGRRLKRQVEAKLSSSPEDVILGLAEDFDSAHLRDIVERLEMAREGGVSYERAISISVDAIEEDIRSQVELDIQKAPTRLTIPMVVGVFGPPLLIGLVPLISRMLEVFAER